MLNDDEGSVVLAVRPAESVPVTLRPLAGNGRIAVHHLGQGEAALVMRAYGRVTVIVAESVPRAGRRALAEHAYQRHTEDSPCTAATCEVARFLLVPTVCDAVTA